jgi:hypothetical protein
VALFSFGPIAPFFELSSPNHCRKKCLCTAYLLSLGVLRSNPLIFIYLNPNLLKSSLGSFYVSHPEKYERHPFPVT